MGLFSYFRRRRNNRRYCAALAVLLGHYMFERLSPGEKVRVDEEVDRNLAANVDWVPGPFWKQAGWDGLASERATAMARLGIEPTAYGLKWAALLGRWKRWERADKWDLVIELAYWPQKAPQQPWDLRSGPIFENYLPMEQPSQDAKQYLRERGLEISDADPPPIRRTSSN